MRSDGRLGPWAQAAIIGCLLATAGAIVAAVLTGVSTFWALAGAAVLAGSGVLAPMVAEGLKSRAEARAVLHEVRDRRPLRTSATGRQVVTLLDPHAEVVPFMGREDERARLLAWCTDEQAGRVRLVAGGAGFGKTRLALWLKHDLSDRGWFCESVRDGKEASVIGVIRKVNRGRVLLIVDYAETRLGLKDLLRAASDDTGRAIRVLLLARQVGDWWTRLETEPTIRAMIDDADRFREELQEYIGAGATNLDVVRGSMPYFAARLGMTCPNPNLVELSGSRRTARVLDLHAAAMVAVLATKRRRRTAISVDLEAVLKGLLDHEKHYWYGRAEQLDLFAGPQGLTVQQLSQIVAAACLLGASTHDDAMHLLDKIPNVTSSAKLVSWLHELYPPSPDEGWLGALRPDRLAELHVIRELTESPELAKECLTGLDERQARQALTMLAYASAEYPAAGQLLESALSRFSQVLPDNSVPEDTMIAVASAIPFYSVHLAEAHAAIVARILATLAPEDRNRVIWLNENTRLLTFLGRKEAALAVAEEATEAARELAAAEPDAYRPDLASSLNNKSNVLMRFRRPLEALRAAEESVTTYRDLAAADPDAFQSGLAMSLTNTSGRLLTLGRKEDALNAVEEAVTIRRELAAADPDAYRPELAMSLTYQSDYLLELGRKEEALTVAEEAVSAYRELAAARPAVFLPDLATSLHNKSNALKGLGRREEALAALEEAVALGRELAVARPAVFLPDLARLLNNQSVFLSELGHQEEEALAAAEEAVSTYQSWPLPVRPCSCPTSPRR